MKLNKLTVALSVVAATSLLAACDGDKKKETKEVVKEIPAQISDNLRAAKTAATCPAQTTDSKFEIKVGDNEFKHLCDIEGVISNDTTLTANNVYRLVGYVTVGTGSVTLKKASDVAAAKSREENNGKRGSVTLTVEAGTHFRSTGRGSLIISRGSKLQAVGTAAKPIVMSSFDYGYDGSGEWGGLVLQGFAKNNKCADTDPCNTADEANTGMHGGTDDADNSGTIKYLIVAEGGYEVAPDSEVNGITLHSVGYGTTLENIMVYGNSDDGVEFFGGAANAKKLILVDNQDESIDWDDGYRGNIQYALVRQGVKLKGDHGIEADNKGASTTATPLSNPILANITFQQNAKGADDLFRFKEGTSGQLHQIAADGYSECIRMEGADTGATKINLENVLIECNKYDDNKLLKVKDGALETNIVGVPTEAATVELGNAFEVTGNAAATLSAAVDLASKSANGSTNFFTNTNYIGAVEPTVTAKENAWWKWASDVIPDAFK